MSHLLYQINGQLLCQSTDVANQTTNVSTDVAVTNMVDVISNYGIMMVISTVVVFFLIRVLDTLLKQTTQSISQIIPKVDSLVVAILDLRTAVIEAITTHNLSMNKKIRELEIKIESCKDQFDHLDKKIDHIENAAHNMEVQVEKIEGIILTMKSELEYSLQELDENDKK